MGRDPKRKMSLKTNLVEGTWVGFETHTIEHIVPGGGPALRIRTVRARPESERWNSQATDDVRAIPDRLNPKRKSHQDVRPERDTEGIHFGAESGHDSQDLDPATRLPGSLSFAHLFRDFRIIDKHLQEHGFTKDCIGCDAKRFNLPKRPHSKQCRERVEAAIKEKDPDAPKLQRRDNRHIRWAEA